MNPQYNEIFTAFQSNKIAVEQFDNYLKQKCGYHYDEHLFQQLIEVSLDQNMIDLESFINQFNETVDTLQYRQEVINNRVKELKILHHQLNDQLNLQQIQQNSISIEIIDCQYIEQRDENVYIQISCGPQTYKTRQVKGNSPKFQEQFDFTIDSSSQDIIITLFDSTNDNMIGFIQFKVNELKESKLKDVNVNFQRMDNMKIKTKIHAILKYNHSKESLYKQEQDKINSEIAQNNIELKETQQAITCLSKVFSGVSIKIHQLPPLLEVQEFEVRYLNTLNSAFEDKIEEWVPLFFKITAVIVALSTIICLYRCQFLELTVLSFMLGQFILKDVNQKWMRIFTYFFAMNFLYDLSWQYLCGGSNGFIHGEQSINKFITGLSYIEILLKIPFTIVLWKHSIEFEQFYSYFL